MFRCLMLSTLMACTEAAAQNAYYLPEVLDSATQKTTIILANTGTLTATTTVAARHDDSTQCLLTFPAFGSTPFSVQLAPGATRLIASGGGGDGTGCAAIVTADAPVSVSQIVTNFGADGTPVSESATAAVSGQELALEYMVPLDIKHGATSGVALYNPGNVSATLTFRLLDETGQVVQSATGTLASHARAVYFGTDDPLAVADFRGTLDVVSSAALAGIAMRKNQANGVTVLPAANQISRRLQFYLPKVVDGSVCPGSAGQNRTTFQLTNLSQNSAHVNLSLSLYDGSPFQVKINGFDTNSTFKSTIGAGATLFWRTSGANTSLLSGAATIQSDQPIGVAALITTFDCQRNFVSETGASPASTDFQFVVPFDTAGNTAGGAAFFNTGSQPLSLNLTLTDQDGQPLATAQIGPLAPGAQMSGMVADFFPAVPVAQGAIMASTGGLLKGFVSAVGLHQSSNGAVSSIPASVVPWTFSATPPVAVTPQLDSAHQVSATIPVTGGMLQVKDAKGNQFTLTLPPNALLNRETITMTAISSATGVSGPGLIAGVQLEPDGLVLLQPAQLKIELSSPAPADTYPIGWYSQAPGTYLNAPLPDPTSLTVALTHFSGSGIGGIDETTTLLNAANMMDGFSSVIGYYLSRGHQEVDQNPDESFADTALARDAFNLEYETVIAPLMQLATASDDDDFMRCAAVHASAFAQGSQFFGENGDTGHIDQIAQATNDFAKGLVQRAFNKELELCKNHDVTVLFSLFSTARAGQLVGLDLNVDMETAQGCQPMLELDYTSEFKYDFSDDFASERVDAAMSGKVILKGGFTADVLKQISDPSQDLYTPFLLSGSGPESYDKLTLTQIADCIPVVNTLTPDVMTVEDEDFDPASGGNVMSQVQFKFNPYYTPDVRTRNGQQLCSFCPVYRKTPVKVELWMDPGNPSENWTETCTYEGATSTSTLPDGIFWWAGWISAHTLSSQSDNGFIQDWALVNDAYLLAQKTISRTVTGEFIISNSVTENTVLTLKPYVP